MKGEWILKEVYFEDGWPSVMRDPIKKWVGITDDEINAIPEGEYMDFYKAIEAKLKEKNNG
jgi:hypothetical protein